MNFGSLFSGIGGIDLGLERAGMTCSWQVEIDEFCRKVLSKHWPDVPKYGDIRDVGKEILEKNGQVDLITGGFPCQPFSVAGKRRGTRDNRHLWPEMLRVISELKPTWVFGENVPGIINIFLDQAISDLETEGYTCESFIFPAVAFDAPHRRDRLFIIAYSSNNGRNWSSKGSVLQGGEQQPSDKEQPGDRWAGIPEGHGNSVGDTKSQSINVSTNQSTKSASQISQLRNSGCERAISHTTGTGLEGGKRGTSEGQRFASESRWLPEPNVDRVANGVPDRVDRLKSLGNAVVPQVAEFIGRIIMEANP